MPVIERKFTPDTFFAKYLVDEKADGMRLDQFLMIFLSGYSREQIKEKIRKREAMIQNRPDSRRPSSKLKWKDIVTVEIHKTSHEDEYWRGELIELQTTPEIVFEDEHLIVINKPPFMATHPTGKHLFNCATVFFEQIHGDTIHSIHRLDRETSGIQLLGKTSKIANEMMVHFEKNQVKKCYFWISRTNEKSEGLDEFTAKQRLGSATTGLERVIVNAYDENSSEGKHAETFFQVVHREKGYAFGLAWPVTGRQHQIRVHAQVHGFPLVGDKLYLGGYPMFQRFKDNIYDNDDCDYLELPRHALHAFALKIRYGKAEKLFVSHLPADFISWYKSKGFELPIEKLESASAEAAQSRL